MKTLCVTLAIIIMFQFYGCTGGEGSRDTHEGIEVVRSGKERVDKKIAVRVEGIFGKEDQAEVIGNPGFIAGDMTGNIYIMDKKREVALKLDSDLNYITSIGQKGEGPGEFSYTSCMTTDGSSRVYVGDLKNKIEIFNDKGQHEQAVKLDFWIDEIFIDKHTGRFTTGYSRTKPNTGERYYYLSDFSLKEKSHSPFFSKKLSNTKKYQSDDVYLVSPYFVLFTGYSGDIYACCGDKYEILIYGKDRKLKKKIIKEYEPIPVSEKELNKVKKLILDLYNNSKNFKNIPEYHPVMNSIAVDEQGQIWIELYKPYHIWKNSYETCYDLFSKNGKYLYSVKIMEKMRTPLVFKNNHVYGGVENKEGDFLLKKIKITGI